MSVKSQQKLLTEFLNLPKVLVKAYRAYEGIGFILQLEAIQPQATCPCCGFKSEKLHQNHWYLVKDLPVSWGQEILDQIEEVSIDLWKAYKIGLWTKQNCSRLVFANFSQPIGLWTKQNCSRLVFANFSQPN